jgi:hypothetical protein
MALVKLWTRITFAQPQRRIQAIQQAQDTVPYCATTIMERTLGVHDTPYSGDHGGHKNSTSSTTPNASKPRHDDGDPLQQLDLHVKGLRRTLRAIAANKKKHGDDDFCQLFETMNGVSLNEFVDHLAEPACESLEGAMATWQRKKSVEEALHNSGALVHTMRDHRQAWAQNNHGSEDDFENFPDSSALVQKAKETLARHDPFQANYQLLERFQLHVQNMDRWIDLMMEEDTDPDVVYKTRNDIIDEQFALFPPDSSSFPPGFLELFQEVKQEDFFQWSNTTYRQCWTDAEDVFEEWEPSGDRL